MNKKYEKLSLREKWEIDSHLIEIYRPGTKSGPGFGNFGHEHSFVVKSASPSAQARKRLWRTYVRRQALYERRMAKWLRSYFRDQGKAVAGHVKGFENGLVVKAGMADWKFPFRDWNKRLAEEAEDFLEELYDDYGTEVLKMLYATVDVAPDLMVSFDVTNPNVQKFLDGYVMKFAQGVNGTVEDRLRRSIGEGVDAGESMRDIGKRVMDEYDSISRYGAERIARTETVRATNMASMFTYEQSGMVEKKEWVVAFDERLCEFCEGMDGEAIPLDEAFYKVGDVVVGTKGKEFDVTYEDVMTPPLHPHCRCCVVPQVVEEPTEESVAEEEEARGFIELVEKFDEDQPRDDEGRWTDAGGGGGRGSDKNREREMSGTTTVDGKRMAADGAPLPNHIQNLYIPPAWTDVRYNPDPDGDLLVKGKDSAGRDQYVYSKKFVENQAAEKFARIKELDEKFDKITRENEANRSDPNPAVRENANCMKLIMETGIRPGGDEDTKAKVAAYGATTLKGSHVVESGGKVELQFVGKKGVPLTIPVENKDTAKMLVARATKAGPEGKLFNTSRESLLDYSHRLNGGKFKTKDFRTYLGTSLAVREMKNYSPPKTMKEYKKSVKEIATVVAKKLGNTPTVALQSYISPVVFSEWRLI